MEPHESPKKMIDPLIFDWLKYIQEVNQARDRTIEEGSEFCIPFIAVPEPIVKELFLISDMRGLAPTTRYLAIHLYDNFMCKHFWDVFTNGIDKKPPNVTWDQACIRIAGQAKLRLVSCIQIASKIDSHATSLGISQVKSILREIDEKQEYTPNTILLSEFKVFQTVGFRIPMGTPLDCVEILLAAMGLDEFPDAFKCAVDLLDLSYLKHEHLYSHFQYMVIGRSAKSEIEKKKFMAMEMNSLLRASAVVLCVPRLYFFPERSIAELETKIADLVDIEENLLNAIARILYVLAVPVESDDVFDTVE